jgi:hypothetical protein
MDNTGTATQLAHEIERYDPSTGNLVAWINLPSVSSSQNTIFYMYYGNPLCESQQNPTDTWNSNFISVWHFNQESGSAYDSKGQHNGTASSGVTQGLPGIIDGAFGFDGITGLVNFGDIYKNMYDFSFWIKPTDVISPETYSTGIFLLSSSPRTLGGFGNCGDFIENETITLMKGPAPYVTAVTNLTISNTIYHLITFNRNESANRYDIYFDGILQSVSNGSYVGHVPLVEVDRFWIGHDYTGSPSNYYDGMIDEVRLLQTSRSSGWILTEFHNQNDPSSFYGIGTETTQQPPATPQRPSGTINGKINTEYTYTTTTTDPDGDSLYYMWNWGDGNISGWYGPYGSNIVANAAHIWTTKGTYEIKVKARDEHGAESNWSEPLSATMPFSYTYHGFHFLEILFERFPHLFPLLRYLVGY